ncbi:MAG: SDR family oxidoreductase [Candidatus Yanofskybacteria bacterium]|nr:SDR family oxidoreductase [Candidatus Yanofskybacteria bacterium]
MSSIPKKLVITGSEGVIGRRLCRHFGRDFDILRLDLSLGHDLTDENFVKGWFAKNRGLYGMIVSHAYNPVAPLTDAKNKKVEPQNMKLDEIRNFFEVNAVSAFGVCQNFIKNNKSGVIVNISSIYGTVSPHHDIYKNFVKPIGYSMSKAALNMMTKYLATYYAPNFRLNTVVLGGVLAGKQNPGFLAEYNKHVPIKRLMAIDELTSVFDFLLSSKSSYITGTEIFVDGGWTAW